MGPTVWLTHLQLPVWSLGYKSELSLMPTSGGTYVYRRTFGAWIGTVTGLGLWISFLLNQLCAHWFFCVFFYHLILACFSFDIK